MKERINLNDQDKVIKSLIRIIDDRLNWVFFYL
jgi:hypothetical protein